MVWCSWIMGLFSSNTCVSTLYSASPLEGTDGSLMRYSANQVASSRPRGLGKCYELMFRQFATSPSEMKSLVLECCPYWWSIFIPLRHQMLQIRLRLGRRSANLHTASNVRICSSINTTIATLSSAARSSFEIFRLRLQDFCRPIFFLFSSPSSAP